MQVNFMNDMVKVQLSLKLNCVNTLAAIHALLKTLLSMDTIKTDLGVMESQQVFHVFLLDLYISYEA